MFNDIAKNIVNQSINKVICIDDDFVEAYTPFETETEGYNISKDLYLAFKDNNRHAKIVRYDINNFEYHNIEHHDLVIIDWKLIEAHPTAQETLKIINYFVSNDMKFVAVYTNEIIEDVVKQIVGYFNILDEQTSEKIMDSFNEFKEIILTEDEDFFSEISDSYYTKGSEGTILGKLHRNSNLKTPFTTLLEEVNSITGLSYNDRSLIKLIGIMNNTQEYKSECDENMIVELSESVNVFKCKNTLITILNKRNVSSQGSIPIEPSDLVDQIANYISNTPEFYMSLVWIELLSNIKLKYRTILTDYNSIDPKLFLFYLNEYGKHSINDIVLDEATFIINNELELSSINKMEQFIAVNNLELTRERICSNPEDILRFNSIKTINTARNIDNHKKMKFGDILLNPVSNKYYLCITPHCDCARPEKINYNYLFVEGEISEDSNTYKKPETLFVSFIKIQNQYKAIEWSKKANMIKFIGDYENGSIVGKNLESDALTFSYVANQKENYTQRIANEASNQFNRVGVTLLSGIES